MTDIKVSPDPIIAGGDGVFTIHGSNEHDKSIPGGTVEVKAGTSQIPLVNTSLDLCSVTKCPMSSGLFDVITKQPFPGFLPSVTFNAEVTGKDANGQLLFCVQLEFKVQQPSRNLV